jgi:hypothetical protein
MKLGPIVQFLLRGAAAGALAPFVLSICLYSVPLQTRILEAQPTPGYWSGAPTAAPRRSLAPCKPGLLRFVPRAEPSSFCGASWAPLEIRIAIRRWSEDRTPRAGPGRRHVRQRGLHGSGTLRLPALAVL